MPVSQCCLCYWSIFVNNRKSNVFFFCLFFNSKRKQQKHFKTMLYWPKTRKKREREKWAATLATIWAASNCYTCSTHIHLSKERHLQWPQQQYVRCRSTHNKKTEKPGIAERRWARIYNTTIKSKNFYKIAEKKN